jgi:hypothetical protein
LGDHSEYFKKLYSNKVENLEEMGKFLDAYELGDKRKEGINHINI